MDVAINCQNRLLWTCEVMSDNWHIRFGVIVIGWEHRFENISLGHVTVKLSHIQQRRQHWLKSIIIFKSGHKHGPTIVKIDQLLRLPVINQLVPTIHVASKGFFPKTIKWKRLSHYITIIFINSIELEKGQNSCM